MARPKAVRSDIETPGSVCGRFTSSQAGAAIAERFQISVPEVYSELLTLMRGRADPLKVADAARPGS
jgi:hypothetical protein